MKFQSCFILLILLFVTLATSSSYAQEQIIEVDVQYVFADQIAFQVTIQTAEEIQEGLIFIRVPGIARDSYGELIQIDASDNQQLFEYVQDLEINPLPPFSDIEYWIEIRLQNGEVIKSDPQTVYYKDNQVNWHTIEDEPFKINWYEGDMAYGLEILSVAREAVEDSGEITNLEIPEIIEIYVYPDVGSLGDVYDPAGTRLQAGHVRSGDKVILIALPNSPDSEKIMRQRIPHEILHAMLLETVGENNQNVPVWLSEGLALMVEQYPDPDLEAHLHESYEEGELLPMESLCSSFPEESSEALLAYAQAGSFTRYLHQRYGSTGIDELLVNYIDGKDCQFGAEAALGKSLTDLESEWRKVVFDEPEPVAGLQALWPWLLVVGLVMIIPLLFSVRSLFSKRQQI